MSTRRFVGLAGAGVALTVVSAGLVSTSTAAVPGSAAPGSSAQCPEAFPAADLTPGTAVTGLTTAGSYTRGTGAGKTVHSSPETPEGFTGTYLSTLEDPTGDLFVVQLEGSRVTNPDGTTDAGIWAGISGSPVYAADGRLVGSVSYGFTGYAGSTYAGVTPAADLYSLLDEVKPAAGARIALDASERRELARAGVPSAALSGGLQRLQAPTVISGATGLSKSAQERIARRAGRSVPTLAGAGATQSREIPVVAGGNVAVADAYGSLALYSVGTASAVCGDVIIGYGHPNAWAEAQGTIHGASTSVIMADGPQSYKMANLGAPVGTLLHDRMAGITGRVGAVAPSALVKVVTSGPGRPGTTETRVPNPEALSYVVATQVMRDAVMGVDQQSRGAAAATWDITFKRASGATQKLTRTQRFDGDVFAEDLGSAVAMDVEAIASQEFEDVTITDVTVRQTVSRDYKALKVAGIEAVQPGGWKQVAGKTAKIKAGKTLRLRVTLKPADRRSKAKATSKIVKFTVPKAAKAGRTSLVVSGNGPEAMSDDMVFMDLFGLGGGDDEEEYTAPTSFDGVIAELRSVRPYNSVDLAVPFALKDGRTVTRGATWNTSYTVSGQQSVTVKVEAAKKAKKKAAKKKAPKKSKR